MICAQKVLNLTVQSIHCPLDIYHQWNYGPPLIQKKLKIDLIGIIIDITIPKNNSIVHCKKEKWFFLLFLTRLDIKFFCSYPHVQWDTVNTCFRRCPIFVRITVIRSFRNSNLTHFRSPVAELSCQSSFVGFWQPICQLQK